jgi:hypothetical protein
MPKIVAFDASSTHVGYCLGDSGAYLTSGVYCPPDGEPHQRVTEIVFWALGLIDRHRPDIVAIEEPAGDHGNRKTDRLLAGVWWSLYTVAVLQGVRRIVRIWPSQVKATRASKDNPAYAAAVAGKRRVTPDEADAIGVWIAAEGKVGQRFTLGT